MGGGKEHPHRMVRDQSRLLGQAKAAHVDQSRHALGQVPIQVGPHLLTRERRLAGREQRSWDAPMGMVIDDPGPNH